MHKPACENMAATGVWGPSGLGMRQLSQNLSKQRTKQG